MQEKDPLKRLAMFSVHYEIRARLHVMKSIFPVESVIQAQN